MHDDKLSDKFWAILSDKFPKRVSRSSYLRKNNYSTSFYVTKDEFSFGALQRDKGSDSSHFWKVNEGN